MERFLIKLTLEISGDDSVDENSTRLDGDALPVLQVLACFHEVQWIRVGSD